MHSRSLQWERQVPQPEHCRCLWSRTLCRYREKSVLKYFYQVSFDTFQASFDTYGAPERSEITRSFLLLYQVSFDTYQASFDTYWAPERYVNVEKSQCSSIFTVLFSLLQHFCFLSQQNMDRTMLTQRKRQCPSYVRPSQILFFSFRPSQIQTKTYPLC